MGEVSLDGSQRRVRHTGLLELQDCSETLLGIIFEMDQWLHRQDGQIDGVRRVGHQRNEAVEELRLIRADRGARERQETGASGDGRHHSAAGDRPALDVRLDDGAA